MTTVTVLAHCLEMCMEYHQHQSDVHLAVPVRTLRNQTVKRIPSLRHHTHIGFPDGIRTPEVPEPGMMDQYTGE